MAAITARLDKLEAENRRLRDRESGQSKVAELATKAERRRVLSAAGVLEGYEDTVPEFDPWTPEGKKVAQDWLAAHPALVKPPPPPPPPRKSMDDLIKDKPGSRWVNREAWATAREQARNPMRGR